MTAMGLFTPKVPDTITDEQMASLSLRAQKANRESMFSKRNVDRRKADALQRSKADKS